LSDKILDIQYYNEHNVTKRVMAMLLRKAGLLRAFPIEPKDFRYYEKYFQTVKQCGKQAFEVIEKGLFLSTHAQMTADSKEGEDQKNDRLAKANNFYDLAWAYGENLNSENFEADRMLMMKHSLMHRLREQGHDTSYYYLPLESEKMLTEHEEHERLERLQRFVSTEIGEMVQYFLRPLLDLEHAFHLDGNVKECHSSEGIPELLCRLEEGYSYGYGYPSAYLNTITHGMSRGRLAIVSGSTNVGKTRNAIADVCSACIPYYYDLDKNEWARNPGGVSNPILFIGTETSIEEIQTSMLACVSGVQEGHIKKWEFKEGEKERVELASRTFPHNSIWIAVVDEPTPRNLETEIRKHVSDHGVTHVYFDYIQNSKSLRGEYEIKNAPTYEVLEHFARELKRFTEKYNIFLQTYTQVNDSAKKEGADDEIAVRGSKAMIDKADFAMIMRLATQKEKDKISEGSPDFVCTIYKNRMTEHKNIQLWLQFDHGTMRVTDCCVTNKKGEILPWFEKSYIIRDERGQLALTKNKKPYFPLSEAELAEIA